MLKVVTCPVETTLSLIGGKWKVLIIKALAPGCRRYGELRSLLGDISAKVLTEQLNEMIEDHLVRKTIYAEIPPRTEYQLTEIGLSLLSILTAMRLWGEEFKAKLERDEIEEFREPLKVNQ